MKFKYADKKAVTVKEGISSFRQDETGEVVESLFIEAGIKGEVIGMGSSSTEDFAVQYDVLLATPEGNIELNVAEKNMESYFDFQ